jgi:hypothetical protein
MRHQSSCAIFGAACLSAFTLLSHSITARAEDAQTHCARVGVDDDVKAPPPDLLAKAAKLFGESARDAAAHRDMYVYRCMSGSVWVCNHGANIPCAKGDMSASPKSVIAYCKENPNQDFVPMVVSGHSAIHSWACVNGKARIVHSERTDSRGFVVDQWRRIE